jgi:transcription elongation factor Elf1
MFIKWECPACKHPNVLNVNLEAKEGKVVSCAQIKCGKSSVIDWQVSVTATAALVVEKKVIGEA